MTDMNLDTSAEELAQVLASHATLTWGRAQSRSIAGFR